MNSRKELPVFRMHLRSPVKLHVITEQMVVDMSIAFSLPGCWNKVGRVRLLVLVEENESL